MNSKTRETDNFCSGQSGIKTDVKSINVRYFVTFPYRKPLYVLMPYCNAAVYLIL